MEKIKGMFRNLVSRFKGLKHKQRIIYLSFVFLAVFIYFFIFYKLPSPYSLKDYKSVPLASQILDRNGKLLYEIYNNEKRTAVKIDDLPDYVWQSSVSIEDKDFFRHKGISFFGGIIRAAKDTLIGHNLQGGSTITQQLVKGALLSPERTIRRKIREIILALWTERIFTKNEVLELYLNQVPYGGSSYGIEEASNTYFGKPAKSLRLHEAAMLAGLPQAPSLYSPQINPQLATRRRNEVLKKMLEEKYITQNQYDSSVKIPVKVLPPRTTIKAPHFVFYVKQILEQEYGVRTVEEGGLKVTTTLDLPTQQAAEKTIKDELESLKNYNVGNGAALVTRPATGEIISMVGSGDFFATGSGTFNVTTALRQPGSSIKPLNYAVGIDRHLVTAATNFIDAPTCFPGGPARYCPKNYDGQFHGLVSLRYALGNSYDIPAVKMLALNGVESFIASASAFGITTFKDPSNYGLSLTLGGGEVRMTEFVQAFSAFPNKGIPKKVNPILKVQDKSGKVIYQFKDPNFVQDIHKPIDQPNSLLIQGKRAISSDAAFIISHILLDNAARTSAFGPGSALVIPGRTVSVKTGTTDDLKDNWTIGYTPNFLTAVWVGNNNNTPMNPYLVSGITGAAPIWNKIMKFVLKDQPNLQPIRPATVVGKQVCVETGGVAGKKPDGSSDCNSRFEYFIRGTEGIITAFRQEKKMVTVTKDSDKLVTDPSKLDPGVLEQKEKTIVFDGYSTYCLDCAGDRLQPSPTPHP